MHEFNRILELQATAKKKSLFLFGARQTGKTFLLKRQFPNSIYFDLLEPNTFFRLSTHPGSLTEELSARQGSIQSPVIIDEIQKLPSLLDQVHYLIENVRCTFVLTGSSSRKLKREGTNLLGGRARVRHLFPLVFPEVPDFDLTRALNFGTIPSIYLSDEPKDDLNAYCGCYLKEEIQSEAIVRRVDNFSRFLTTASLINAELLNYHSVARDAEIAVKTIREYFDILQDTLIGTTVLPYKKTVHRKAVSMSKFYFFDVGVCNTLARRSGITPGNELFGKSFEQFIFCEINSYLHYAGDDRPLTFWRDSSKNEVDFVIGDEIAIEVKGASHVQDKHLRGLSLLSSEIALKNKIVVSLDSAPRKIGDILILPWKEFLTRLWSGEWRN